MALTVAAGAALSHLTPAIPNHVEAELERLRETNGAYLYDAGYADDAEYVLVGQIPSDDYSRGGVYFIGDSEMSVALHCWRLPPEEQRLIHNYSIGAMRHHNVDHLIHMLVEDFDLLRAGGDRTTIFLSLSYYLARPPFEGVSFAYYVERLGLYTYPDEAEMHPAPLSPVGRWLRLEYDRAKRFTLIALGRQQSHVMPPAPEFKNSDARRLEGDWRAAMRAEVDALEGTLIYLQERGVRVVAIFPPSGSWDEALPYTAAYRELVIPLLEARGVPLIDESAVLADDNFADGNHPTYESQLVLHGRHREAARRALEEMGVRPGDNP